MKIWSGFGSEHSMNLVMIGRFKNAQNALETKDILEQLMDQVRNDEKSGLTAVGEDPDQYTDGVLELLQKVRVHHVGPAEMLQFAFEFSLSLNGDELVVTTDESDFSAFLKVLLDGGAKVEVYSAHDYPDTGLGR